MEASAFSHQFYLNNCRNIFNKFLETNRHLCDVTLIGDDGKNFLCHRFVLAACSSFFERVFDNYTKQTHIGDVDKKELVLLLATYKSTSIQRMVEFIYYGILPECKCRNDENDTDDDIIRLASELKINGLHELLLAEKRTDADAIHKVPEKIADYINDSIPDERSSEASDSFHSFSIVSPINVNIKHELNEEHNLSTPKEILKSSPRYESWLKALSRIKGRQADQEKNLLDKNPLELLNDIIEGVQYLFSSFSNDEHECLAKIEGQCFTGKGANKKAAKLNAVKKILNDIFDIKYEEPHVPDISSLTNVSNDKFQDKVERIILEKYSLLTSKRNYYSDYKVIAGVVQSTYYFPNSLKVVSIGTGSKFLYENHLDSTGNAVHDTHAEIVARRGLIRYIYNQINQCIANSSQSIFQKDDDLNGKFRLKTGIKFHLYVSSAPCGDARVYSHANSTGFVQSAIPTGKLRTKGENALTITKDSTTDDVFSVNMSCSAKLLKWNILGIQGALLSNLIEKIYLSSIILGEKFNKNHLERALYRRIESDWIKFPQGFNINQLELMKVSDTKAKPSPSSPNHSINWNAQCDDVEILQSTSGRIIGIDKTRYSRISRRAFFNEFNKIGKKLNHPIVDQIYSEAKLSALEYQAAKSTLFQIFENNDLGMWVRKRHNLNDFKI